LISKKKATSSDRLQAQFVWPIKCHSVGVIAATNIGMTSPAQGSTRSAAATQTSDEPQQPFSESLLAASAASSETDSVNDGSTRSARRQKSASEDAKTASAVSDGGAVLAPIVPQPSAPLQQAVPAQTAQVADPSVTALQVSPGGTVASTNASTAAAGQPDSDRLPSASIWLGEVQSIKSPIAPLPEIGNSVSKAGGNTATSAGPNAAPIAASSTVQQAVPNVSSNAAAMPAAHVAANTGQNTVPSAAQDMAGNAVQNSIPNAVVNAVSTVSSNAASMPAAHVAANTGQGTVPSAAQDMAGNTVQNSIPNAVVNAVSTVSSNAASMPAAHAAANTGQDAVPSAAQNMAGNTVQNSIPNAVANAVSNAPLNTEAVAALHSALNASAKAALASALNTTPANQASAPAAAANANAPAADLSVPNVLSGTADQFVSLTQTGGVSLGTVRAGVSSVNPALEAKTPATNGTGGSKGVSNDATGLKQHAQPASDQTGSQAGSQEATSSGDQNHGDASQQGQNTAPALMNFASHTTAVSAQVQNTATASLTPSGSTHAGVAASAAKTPDNAASLSATVPQAPPVINTAKLIQSMGQSEMRVGMRSNEFGNISINTSTSKDLISAQISLDHGELAKALAAQLPEMQARLGSNQAMDVRIDMSGAGTSGSMSNGSADQSRDDRQQPGYSAQSYASSSAVDRQISPAAAATGYGGINARLDIRV
jgi:hypothetical protein